MLLARALGGAGGDGGDSTRGAGRGAGASVAVLALACGSVKRGALRVPSARGARSALEGRGITGGLPVQVLFGSLETLAEDDREAPPPPPTAGSPGKPEPRGARSPPISAARA